MTSRQFILLKRIIRIINRDTSRRETDPEPDPEGLSVGHLKWMVHECLGNHKFPIDKVDRWIGYIQGVMRAHKYATLEELKQMSIMETLE